MNRDIFSIFFNMRVYCVFSLESPQQGDSNEYTQHTISQYKKEIHPKLSQICNYGVCSKGPKNEFEPAVVNERSVVRAIELLLNFFVICQQNVFVMTYHENRLGKTVLMRIKHSFYGEVWKIIPKVLQLPFSSETLYKGSYTSGQFI